jgi:hypothetical protein
MMIKMLSRSKNPYWDLDDHWARLPSCDGKDQGLNRASDV